MIGLILGFISIALTMILALLPIIIKALKWSGIWVVLLYLIIVCSFQGLIMKYSNGQTPTWCYIGLYVSAGISAVLLMWKIIKAIFDAFGWIFDKIRGYR